MNAWCWVILNNSHAYQTVTSNKFCLPWDCLPSMWCFSLLTQFFFGSLGTKKCYEPLVVLIDFFDLTPPYHLVGESGRQLALCHISDEVDFVSRKTWGTTHHFLGIPQNFYHHHGSRSRSGHQIRRSRDFSHKFFVSQNARLHGSQWGGHRTPAWSRGRGIVGASAVKSLESDCICLGGGWWQWWWWLWQLCDGDGDGDGGDDGDGDDDDDDDGDGDDEGYGFQESPKISQDLLATYPLVVWHSHGTSTIDWSTSWFTYEFYFFFWFSIATLKNQRPNPAGETLFSFCQDQALEGPSKSQMQLMTRQREPTTIHNDDWKPPHGPGFNCWLKHVKTTRRKPTGQGPILKFKPKEELSPDFTKSSFWILPSFPCELWCFKETSPEKWEWIMGSWDFIVSIDVYNGISPIRISNIIWPSLKKLIEWIWSRNVLIEWSLTECSRDFFWWFFDGSRTGGIFTKQNVRTSLRQRLILQYFNINHGNKRLTFPWLAAWQFGALQVIWKPAEFDSPLRLEAKSVDTFCQLHIPTWTWWE